MADGQDQLSVKIEVSGGLDLLFGVKQLSVAMPKGSTMRELIATLRTDHVKERPELFAVDGDVRPGILVLINDEDWELDGRLAYALQDGDSIAFVSTLHGG